MKLRLLLGICALLLVGAVGCKKDAAYDQLTQHRAPGEKGPTYGSGAAGTETDPSANTASNSDDDPSVEDKASQDRRADARKSLGL